MPNEPRRAAPKKPKAATTRRKMHGPYAQTVEQSLSHIKLNIQATVPGMLDTDELFRRMIIGYLFEHYRTDVLDGLQIARRKAEAAHA